jgi:NTP pyrophosphatase (non-canonical NTP hydrolase)
MSNEMWERNRRHFEKFESDRIKGLAMKIKVDIYETQAADFEKEGTSEEVLFMGIASEVGELVGEHLEEVRVDRDGKDCTEEVLDELSDVLWYVARIAARRGSNLESLMMRNLVKLGDRELNGKKHYKNKG